MTETLLQDLLQALRGWKQDLVEHTPAEERIRQLSLAVARDHHNWTDLRGELVVRFRNGERHPIDLVEQIVGEIARRLVDLVDEHQARFVAGPLDRLAERFVRDVIAGRSEE